MEYICGNCKYYKEKKGKSHCWITGKTVSFDQPICTFNFRPKEEEK